MQQLTCKIDSSNYFYYLFFSFVLLELEPFVFKWKVLGENSEKVPKSAKSVNNYETILPFSCCPLVFFPEFALHINTSSAKPKQRKKECLHCAARLQEGTHVMLALSRTVNL